MDSEESRIARFLTAYVADTEVYVKNLKADRLLYRPK